MEKEKETARLHRLSGLDERKIYELVGSRLEILPGDSTAARKEKENRRKAFDDFMTGLTPMYNGKPRASGPRRLCYEHLPALTAAAGVSYLDIFRAVSRDPDGNYEEPRWASELETNMCSYCDLLSPSNRKLILDLIRSMLPPSFEDPELENTTPLLKLTKTNTLRTYCGNETARQITELGMDKQYRRRNIIYSYNALELSILPYVAANFDVSLHWLLGLDESATVLAACGETETIMKLFCFLPDERKNIVYHAVDYAVNEGGAL